MPAKKPARKPATERTKIEIVETWDGSDVRTHEAAKLEIELSFFRSYSYGTPSSREAKAEILRLLEREIQPVANHRFGKGNVRVKVTKVTAGSLTIFFTLVTIGGGVFAFFKGYEDFRKGLLKFVDDLKRVGQRFEKRATGIYKEVVRRDLNRRSHNRARMRH